MVNYDLPRNPNRLKQRFGQIDRLGWTELCHLRNRGRREHAPGEVYRRLLAILTDQMLAEATELSGMRQPKYSF